ncbi:hypothetical protein [Euzebya pacifica]|uniref:hypothetical protein n=1 Tax=Euzebya pacifica TaxID=1608957 RepID=UPI0030FAD0A5
MTSGGAAGAIALALVLAGCSGPDLVDVAHDAGVAVDATTADAVLGSLTDDPVVATALLLDADTGPEAWRALLEADVDPTAVAVLVEHLAAEGMPSELLTSVGGGLQSADDVPGGTVLLLTDAIAPALVDESAPTDGTGLTSTAFEAFLDGVYRAIPDQDVAALTRLLVAHQARGLREWGPALLDDASWEGRFFDSVGTSVAAVMGPLGRALTDRVGDEDAEAVLDESLSDVEHLLAVADPDRNPQPSDRMTAAAEAGAGWTDAEIPVQAHNFGAALAVLSIQHALDDGDIRARLVPDVIAPEDVITGDPDRFPPGATRTLASGAVVGVNEVIFGNLAGDIHTSTIAPLERRWQE